MKPQIDKIKRGVDILVATPGRLLDLAGQGFLDLSSIEILVLDEADRMLDMGFIHDVKKVLAMVPKGLVTAIDVSSPRPVITPFTLRFVKR